MGELEGREGEWSLVALLFGRCNFLLDIEIKRV
jgi:hypothetical protein